MSSPRLVFARYGAALRTALMGLLAGVLLLALGGSAARAEPGPTAGAVLYVSNPRCVQARQAGTCRIQAYVQATNAGSESLDSIVLSIDAHPRLRMTGFFEGNGYLDPSVYREGLLVSCGGPGSGGVPGFGHLYNLRIDATWYSLGTTTDTANVLCPAYQALTYLPGVRR